MRIMGIVISLIVTSLALFVLAFFAQIGQTHYYKACHEARGIK